MKARKWAYQGFQSELLYQWSGGYGRPDTLLFLLSNLPGSNLTGSGHLLIVCQVKDSLQPQDGSSEARNFESQQGHLPMREYTLNCKPQSQESKESVSEL